MKTTAVSSLSALASKKLSCLSIQPDYDDYPSTSATLNLLAAFQFFIAFNLDDDDIKLALAFHTRNFGTLSLESAPHHPNSAFNTGKVWTLCWIVEHHPQRFPALKFVQLSGWDSFSFHTVKGRAKYRKLAVMLDKVGLVMLDRDSVLWQSK